MSIDQEAIQAAQDQQNKSKKDLIGDSIGMPGAPRTDTGKGAITTAEMNASTAAAIKEQRTTAAGSESALEQIQASEAAAAEERKKRAGRSSTLLTGGRGVTKNQGTVSRRTLMGY